MATQIQWRRGNTAQTATFTGAVAEITVDTDKKTIVVHDGTTAGGIPLAKESSISANAAIAQGAYDKANSANVLAQASFNFANTANIKVDSAFAFANVANTLAQAAFDQANTANIKVDSAYAFANVANTLAQAAFDFANTANTTADAAFDKANTANVLAQAAFDFANTANIRLDSAYAFANGAYDKANSANVLAQAAFDKANSTTQQGFVTVAANGTNVVADANNDTLTISSANGIGITSDDTTDTITINLTPTGVTSGTYGGATQIPTFAVDAQGRLTSAGNVEISTPPSTLNIAADTGTNTISLSTNTLTFFGGDGITSSIGPTDNVKFDVDNTVIRTSGEQTITGNLSITGDLIIIGNTVVENVSSLSLNDPLIQLAANNEISDALDIGFYGHFSDDGGVSKRHAGLFRDTSTTDKRFILFTNLIDSGLENSAAITVNTAQSSFATANLQTNIIGGRVSGLTQAIDISDGGTNATSFNTGNLIFFNGTSLTSIANTGTAGTYANASHVPVITTDAYGRVSAVTNTSIAIAATQVTSGTLNVAQGGTGQTTYSNGQLLIGNTTGNTLVKATLTGTTDQITVTNGAGSITLSTPQSIGTANSVQFGSFGVGTAASGTTGEIRATNNITAYYSDRRLKENIEKLQNALDKIKQISGVTFNANDEAAKYGYTDKKKQVGVIAQEIEQVLPEIVVPAPFDIAKNQDGVEYSISGENYKTVQYEKIIPLLIEAIKELDEKLEFTIKNLL